MILVDSADAVRDIYDRSAQSVSLPDEPRVPPDSSNHQRWDFCIQTAGKEEVINVVIKALAALPVREINDLLFPCLRGEINGRDYVRVPAPAHHQELASPFKQLLQRHSKILCKNDVAVRVTKEITGSDLLRPAKNGIKPLRSAGVHNDFWLMAQSQL